MVSLYSETTTAVAAELMNRGRASLNAIMEYVVDRWRLRSRDLAQPRDGSRTNRLLVAIRKF